MIDARSGGLAAIVRANAAIEIGTGSLLLIAPSPVVDALVGPSTVTTGVVGRVLGGALLSLGVAGATGRMPTDRRIATAYLTYDLVTAAILGAAGIAGTATRRLLLWPAVATHGALAAGLMLRWKEMGESAR